LYIDDVLKGRSTMFSCRLLGESLRHRAQELSLSDAEVARRAGLSSRRYGHYATGSREPDLATLIRICRVQQTTPNALLGFEPARKKSARDKLIEKLTAAASTLEDAKLKIAVRQIEAMVG
jgi:transcriptional regulator with XRE-family HTH domain